VLRAEQEDKEPEKIKNKIKFRHDRNLKRGGNFGWLVGWLVREKTLKGFGWLVGWAEVTGKGGGEGSFSPMSACTWKNSQRGERTELFWVNYFFFQNYSYFIICKINSTNLKLLDLV